MRKKWTILIAAGCLVVAVLAFGLSGFTSFSASDNAAFEAAVAANNVLMQTGVVPLDSLQGQVQNASLNSATDKAGIILHAAEEQEAPAYEKYYPSARAEQLDEMHAAALQNLDGSEVTVGGGTIDNRLQGSEDISPGEKRITVSGVSWLETIYQADGQYAVNLIFNQDTTVYHMVNEGGSWIVAETVNRQKEFAPNGYQGDKGTFDSLQEALDFAAQLDVEEECPF